MNWISIAILSYFLIALGVILDKFLLSSKRVAHPATYAFYSGIMSFFTIFIFFPTGKLHLVSAVTALWMFGFGFIFFVGVLFLFFAIQKSEASRVIPVVGAVTPIISFVIESLFLQKAFLSQEIFGILILILGGLLISFDLPIKLGKKKFFTGFYYSIFAGAILAVGLSGLSYFYKLDNFFNVFSWSRMGLTIGAFALLLVPAWRKIIWKSIFGNKNKKEKKSNWRTGNLFVLNKILNGIGSALTSYAIAIGSVTVVNALVSVEYVFIFILALIFHGMYPEIFSEKNKPSDLMQKIMAILIIAVGIILITK